jgi:hypothetical protein
MIDQDRQQHYDQVSGIFNSYQQLDQLLDTLYMRGLREEDISVLMSERTRDTYLATKDQSKAPEGATVGSVSGAVVGAIIGGLTLVGSIVIPGAGLLAAGPLVGAITGGAAGAATGGLIGALIGAGIPEHEAKFFEDALKQEGNALVVAHVPHDESKEFRAMFERCGARQIQITHSH